jgi:hypothetical protein
MASSAGCFGPIIWFHLGVAGFLAAVAAGFCVYAGLLVHAVFRVREPAAAGTR